jgi:hypothetical protein
MRVTKAFIVLLTVMCVALIPASVNAAQAGGAVQIWATPTLNGSGATVVVTGAIGDYGKVLSETAAGKPNQNGHLQHFMLKKGTFIVNSTNVDNKANSVPPTVNATTCSAYATATGTATLVSGTGAYKGISGTFTVTESFAFLGPRIKTGAKKGQCNQNQNAQAVAAWGAITGTGTVSFG